MNIHKQQEAIRVFMRSTDRFLPKWILSKMKPIGTNFFYQLLLVFPTGMCNATLKYTTSMPMSCNLNTELGSSIKYKLPWINNVKQHDDIEEQHFPL